MWQELTRTYALRAREFSDAVARLGQHHRIGPEFVGLIRETKRLRRLCDEAANQLDLYISQAGECEAKHQ
jgi:hypothetical protein